MSREMDKLTQQPASESIRKSFNAEDPLNWSDYHQKLSRYFTVGEVLQYDPRRVPKDVQVIGNILALSEQLDLIREEWGSSIGVTSWYRPPLVNPSSIRVCVRVVRS